MLFVFVSLKGILSSSNNIILWHKSEDTKKKNTWFPKFQLIPIYVYKLYMIMLCFIAPYCVELSFVDKTFCENCSHFILKWFQLNSFGEMCILKESYKNMQKFMILKIWKCLLYKIREHAFKLLKSLELVQL